MNEFLVAILSVVVPLALFIVGYIKAKKDLN
jgi:hypothetical protein